MYSPCTFVTRGQHFGKSKVGKRLFFFFYGELVEFVKYVRKKRLERIKKKKGNLYLSKYSKVMDPLPCFLSVFLSFCLFGPVAC